MIAKIPVSCPGLDSNQHVLSNTTTSKWLVYQFQHPGYGAANVKCLPDLIKFFLNRGQEKCRMKNKKQIRTTDWQLPAFLYFFNTILNVVPFPGSECFTYNCPL